MRDRAEMMMHHKKVKKDLKLGVELALIKDAWQCH